MTTFITCAFCGARVLSPAALDEHLDRCRRVNGWDRHVEVALAIGAPEKSPNQTPTTTPTGMTKGAVEVSHRLSKAISDDLTDLATGIADMGRAAGIDTRTDPLGGAFLLATHADHLTPFVERARARRQS